MNNNPPRRNIKIFLSLIIYLAILTVGLIILHTALANQMLQEGLPGYREYSSQVRFRLIPELW